MAVKRPRPLGVGARRLRDELTGNDQPGTRPFSWVEPAVVKTVTAGAAADTRALVVVTWRGTDVAVPYLESYTPVVGHTVQLNVQPPALLILGRAFGTPA